jgi:rhamnogalacturonyl hydrolase YesR
MLSVQSICAKCVFVTDKMPEKTVNRYLKEAQAGDTVFFRKGHYRMNLLMRDKHGLPDNPVVIMGEDRGNTILDGGAEKPGTEMDKYGFYFDNCSWITVSQFSFRNCWLDVIRVKNSGYISLTHSHITGGRRAFFAEGRNSHHFLIEQCYWEQGEHVWKKEKEYSWAELHHGQYRYYNGSLFQGKQIGGSFVIRDNYIKNVYNGIRLSVMDETTGLDTLACTNGEIYRNVIENSADNAFEPEVYCKNLHFYHNKMINSHAFISVTEVGGGPLWFYGNTGVKLPDCRDGWTVFKFMGKERRMTKPLYIFNNSWQVDSDILGRKQENHWHNDHIYHFNNAYFISNADTVGIYYSGLDNRFENDCANIPFPGRIVQQAKYPEIASDPMFLDGKHGNFLLKEGSPCRNKGIIPENIPIGFTGEKLDIGAYDDGCLVEGPPFRYEDPGIEMPDKEKPRIVRYKIENKRLKLWFSYPLAPASIQAENFCLNSMGNSISFHRHTLQEDGYLLVLEAAQTMPLENISLATRQKPKGTNGEEMTFWASALPSAPVSKAEQIREISRKIADHLMATTTFDFEPQEVTFNANVAHLDIDSLSGSIIIYSENEKSALLGFSFKGNIRVFLNKKLIYSGMSGKEDFREYAYNRFRFANEQNIELRKGENELLVEGTEGMKGVTFSCCVLKPDRLYDTEVAIREWKPMIRQAFVVPHFQTNKKGFNADWHYANSNTLLGILNLYHAYGDYRYKRFVEMYNQSVIDNYDFFKEQYFSKRIMRGAYFRLFRATMLDDTGGAILPFAEMALMNRPDSLSSDILNRTLDYVLHKQSRLTDGTLCRPEPVEHTVWADDLFMSVPFLVRMATLNHDAKLYDEAIRQILLFDKHLADPQTNIYKHGWFDDTQTLAPVAWSRANGWIIWAMSEALLQIPSTHTDYEKVKEIFIRRLKAISVYQSEDGRWRQILDHPASFLETSGTAMFAIGLARAIRMGWLSKDYSLRLNRAWNVICRQIDEKGNVSGICRSTELSPDAGYYLNQKTSENDPRGLGAVLTLAAEMYLSPIENK